jgi:predicted nucleotidyltransferase
LKHPAIRLAFVFGSVARGEEKGGSDVDLMVIGGLGLRELAGLLSGVPERIGRSVNPHVLSVAEFRKRIAEGEHLVTQILASPKLFVIGSENELGAVGQ